MLRIPDKPAEPSGGRLQAVLFDMDGLLVDSEPLWFEAELAVIARLDGEWAHEDQRALLGGSLATAVEFLLARARRPSSPDQVANWLTGEMAGLIAGRDLAVMPGALELLREVRSAGVPHALVTSSERVIMEAVMTQLARYDASFEVTVCGADVVNTKPHPEPYQRAAALLGVDPRMCVALEDSPNGVAAAEAAGCVTVAVPSLAPVPARAGRLVAASLTELDLATLSGLVTALCSDRRAAGDSVLHGQDSTPATSSRSAVALGGLIHRVAPVWLPRGRRCHPAATQATG